MSSRHAEDHFNDILGAIARIQDYAAGLSFQTYQSNDLSHDAIERQMSILSEAATRLREQAEVLCPGPDWPRIREIGNVLRHEYHKIADRIIWDIIQTKLPTLRSDVAAALERYLRSTAE